MESSSLLTWVCDELHEVTGMSDRSVAEFLLQMARKSRDVDDLMGRLRDTGAIDVDGDAKVNNFARQLFQRVPKQGSMTSRAGAAEAAKRKAVSLFMSLSKYDRLP
jgi:hypothetical protein